MRERQLVNQITHKGVKKIRIKEYDYKDIINYDNAIGRKKKPYIDTVLRKRLKHITNDVERHGKPKMMYGMAVKIFYCYIKLIIHYLFQAEELDLEGLGSIKLTTERSSSFYDKLSSKSDRVRSKNFGYYTKISVKYYKCRSYREFRYGYPYWSFGKHIKKKLQQIENTGFKY